MDKKYQFPGEVTMSIEQYNDIIMAAEKANKDAEMYRAAYVRKIEEFNDLEAKYEKLKAESWTREEAEVEEDSF